MDSSPLTQPAVATGWRLVGRSVNPLRRYSRRSAPAVMLGLTPPLVFACLAQASGDWRLFERSGSITTAIGLLVASRPYIRHSIVELALPRSEGEPGADVAAVIEEILTAKVGLALSGFGTVVWGWGAYCGWWSFAYLLAWIFFALRDAHRDRARIRDHKSREPASRGHHTGDARTRVAGRHRASGAKFQFGARPRI